MSEWVAAREPDSPLPFSNWIANDEWVIVTGMVGLRQDGTVSDSVTEQARQTLATIESFLQQAGSALSEIVMIAIHITDRTYAEEVESVLSELLPEPRPVTPALTIVETLAVAGCKVEFHVWAHRGAKIVPWASGPATE